MGAEGPARLGWGLRDLLGWGGVGAEGPARLGGGG